MANLSFYAVCPFGLEELLAGEISACGAERIRAARGGVSFSGSAATAMAVCLNSRLASRVLMKVAEAPTGTPATFMKWLQTPLGRSGSVPT